MTEVLASRVVSAFPLSVATSLALESIFEAPGPSIDPERVIPQKVNIFDYNEFWLNLSTLTRNILGSLPREDSSRVFPGELADVLDGEVEMIQFITSQQSYNKTTPIFYVSNYQDMQTSYPHSVLRMDRTDNQKQYRSLHNKTIELFLKKNEGSDAIKIFKRNLTPSNRPTALIMTHMAYDLVSYKAFSKLDLIESHTGILKSKALWYTKYQDGKNLPVMPFEVGLMQVFGDKETFAIKDIKLKKAMIELAQQNQWTAVTSREKIFFDLDKLKNPYHAEIVKSMMRT